MKSTDWIILGLMYIGVGWLLLRFVFMSITVTTTMMEVKGYKKLAWVMTILCLLFWPICLWIANIISRAWAKHIGVVIPEEEK